MSQQDDEDLNTQQLSEVEAKVKKFLKVKGMVIPENAKMMVDFKDGEVVDVAFLEGEPHRLQ